MLGKNYKIKVEDKWLRILRDHTTKEFRVRFVDEEDKASEINKALLDYIESNLSTFELLGKEYTVL